MTLSDPHYVLLYDSTRSSFRPAMPLYQVFINTPICLSTRFLLQLAMLLYQVFICGLICCSIRSYPWPNMLLNHFLLYEIYIPPRLIFQLTSIKGYTCSYLSYSQGTWTCCQYLTSLYKLEDKTYNFILIIGDQLTKINRFMKIIACDLFLISLQKQYITNQRSL